jgi:ABC-type Fe3+ transport system substrate-binding protein
MEIVRMSLHSCWVCQELRKRYGYKGCIKTDRLQESKDLIDRLLLEINSPRKDDVILSSLPDTPST